MMNLTKFHLYWRPYNPRKATNRPNTSPAEPKRGARFVATELEVEEAAPAPVAVEREDFVPVPDSQQVSFAH